MFYTNRLTSGKLNTYLNDVDKRAIKQVYQLVESVAKADGTDENLKAQNYMQWVGLMNNYLDCAEEIVFQEVVFA